jgi:glucose dehydrogenase
MKRVKFSFFGVLLVLTVITLMVISGACTKVDNIPTEVKQSAKDWPLMNRDYSNTRATTDSEINSGNVSKLGIAWSFNLPGSSGWGAAASNPLILGDTVYFQDLKSNVFALDLKSGEIRWDRLYNLDNIGPNGPAVAWGKVFVAKGHYEVAALDMNGKELWSTKISDKESVGIDIQPTPYGNMIYVSSVPGVSNQNFYKGGSVGVIYALDQGTGKIKWSFDTVDSKDIWGNPDVNSGGGSWQPPAIDTKTNTMYWGVGNPAPWPGTEEFPNGTSRPGPNLYTDSILALNHQDGKLLWFKQVRPHDLFDLDFQISPVLATATINGVKRDIVIGAGKLGKVFAFDRKSGEILWETSVGEHKNDDLTELPEGTTRVLPGALGGVETPMAYAEGTLFVPIVNLFSDYTPAAFDFSTFDFTKGTGELVAIDVNNGKIIWDQRLDSINVGAATVVNDIVFTSTFDGKIYAFNCKTGDQVWNYQAPGGINGWPAVAGDTIIFPVGLGNPPVLIAFRLGATTPTTTETTTTTTPSGP